MAALILDEYTQTGYAIELLAQSEYHKQYPMGHYLRTEVMPAIWNAQARFYIDQNGQPTAMVTWAWLSEEIEKDIHVSGRALNDDEWRSGERLFFSDWIAPYGTGKTAMQDMAHNVFPNEKATSIRRHTDGSVKKINRWTGINLRQSQMEANL